MALQVVHNRLNPMLRRKKSEWFLILIFVSSIGACSLIADYNPETHKQLVSLQVNIVGLFKQIKSSFGTTGYSYFQKDYLAIDAQLNKLIQQAEATPMNEDSTKQLKLLKSSMHHVQSLHEKGFKNIKQIKLLQSSIDSQL